MTTIFAFTIIIALTLAAVSTAHRMQNIPQQHLYPNISWRSQPLRAPPQVSNYLASASLQSDFIGIGPIAAAPFTANFQNSSIRFNGRPVRVETVGWRVCEGTREATAVVGATTAIKNSVRALFGQRVFAQKWEIIGGDDKTDIDMFLDGPYARRCDDTNPSEPAGKVSCGWGFRAPIGRNGSHFLRRVTRSSSTPTMRVTDKLTTAATESVLLVTASSENKKTLIRGNNKKKQRQQLRALEASCAAAQQGISAALGPDHTWGNKGNAGFGFFANVTLPAGCTLWHVLAIDFTAAGTDALLQPFLLSPSMPEQLFDQACSDSLAHFRSAFSPADAGVHFSGSLPSLVEAAPALTTSSSSSSSSSTGDISKLIDWSLTALISLERLYGKTPGFSTNNSNNASSSAQISYPRQFVISDGPSPSYRGGSGEGNSGAFSWDLSFAAISYTLVDPDWTRAQLTYIVANTAWPLDDGPLLLPQAWDNFDWSRPVSALGTYCFDFIAVFSFIQSYVVYSGDFAFLSAPIPSMQQLNNKRKSASPLDVLRGIAWSWKAYPRSAASEWLVDYGDNKRDFLEAAETYKGVVPALQASNAGMMLSFANLLETMQKKNSSQQQYAQEILHLRGNASNILGALVEFQYQEESGAWRCLNAYDKSGVEVRCICDSVYIPLASILSASSSSSSSSSSLFTLPKPVRDGMTSLFTTELLANGWTRALSLKDKSMSGVNCHPLSNCTIEDLVGMRSDWTATGSYAGVAGLAIDAMAELNSNFAPAVSLLRNLTLAAKVTQPAQGIAVMSPPAMVQYLANNDGIPPPKNGEPFDPGFAEFFDEAGFGGPWPRTERSIQNAAGSIHDALVRSIFGWRPTWELMLVVGSEDEAEIAAAITASLWRRNVPRADFRGTLRWLRTPWRHIQITAGDAGLTWKYESS